ncbi:hypothetical protein AVEN_90236-1 [Araneus ventricosus]|uniref:Uncharacterized protein n=1 Tax=Araneus ventricosus TaxID=182803 RepID=A0A4Y2VN36_ARAVE|nr:hypothetical protein AVEN_90236-1 [Araneus ventricosus]
MVLEALQRGREVPGSRSIPTFPGRFPQFRMPNAPVVEFTLNMFEENNVMNSKILYGERETARFFMEKEQQQDSLWRKSNSKILYGERATARFIMEKEQQQDSLCENSRFIMRKEQRHRIL